MSSPPTPSLPRRELLSPREKECLLWTLRGKSAWETATILGISENTVVKIVRSATHKLGAPNKQSAAIKAMRLGLLDEAQVGPAPLLPPSGPAAAGCDPASWPTVEVAAGALGQLSFAHLATDKIQHRADAPASAVTAPYVARGRTTWQAPWSDGLRVFLQWTWTLESGGIVLLENPLQIQTNAHLPAGQGAVQAGRVLLLECMGVIHRLDWQETVRSASGAPPTAPLP
jgi:DNA-binding CsgD family transcriptional regulator